MEGCTNIVMALEIRRGVVCLSLQNLKPSEVQAGRRSIYLGDKAEGDIIYLEANNRSMEGEGRGRKQRWRGSRVSRGGDEATDLRKYEASQDLFAWTDEPIVDEYCFDGSLAILLVDK